MTVITYTDERMTIAAIKCVRSAQKYGATDTKIYGDINLSETFKEMASPTIKEERGAGLYIWKPFIIWQQMNKMKDGELLIYSDAGQEFVSDIKPVADCMDEDIMFFSNGWPHVDWCKADVYETIIPRLPNHSDDIDFGWQIDKKATIFRQTQASLIFFKVNQKTKDFVKEWMLYLLMPGFCDNSPSKLPNYPTFQESRWDQSVLCCLQIKYGYKLHWFPTLTNMHQVDASPGDRYKPIIDHHRKRNNEW